MKKSRISIFLVSVFLLILSSCSNSSQQNTPEIDDADNNVLTLTKEQIAVAGIETGKLEKALVADVIDCTGTIDVPPTNKGTLHAPMDGIIQSIHAVPGIYVQKNEVLATLADQEIAQLQESFLDQRSNRAYLETEFQRKKKLYEQDAISKKDFLTAQHNYNLAVYKCESLREQLIFLGISEEKLINEGITSTISIMAPFHGYVSDVFVNIGMYVDENKPMFEIVNYDHVHLELSVYSNDIGKIELGQAVRFRFAGSEKGGWGEIQLIGKKVDETNRSLLVHAHIDESETELTIGASIMAEILTNSDSAFCLPEEAIIKQGDLSFVYVERNDGFIKTPVVAGRSYNGFVELLNFQELTSASIVTKGAYYLAD